MYDFPMDNYFVHVIYIYIIGLILQHFEGHDQIILYVSLNRVQAALHNRDEWKKSYKI